MRIRTAIILACLATLVSGPAIAVGEEESALLQLFYPGTGEVVSSSRSEKPLSQVAENVTVATARQIEELNVHSLGQLLSHVTGLMADFQGEGYAGGTILHVQGSHERQVLVLVDGIPWNLPSGGVADISGIPVGIIERVEIVKGPASSAWGSSLGGVINVITKAAGDGGPRGSLSVYGGEHASWDMRAEAAGRVGPAGYYLHASRLDSDGLRDGRFVESNAFYGKVEFPLGREGRLTLAAGGSEPAFKFGDYPADDLSSEVDSRTLHGTVSLDLPLASSLAFNASFYALDQEYTQTNDVFGSGLYGAPGDLFMETVNERDGLGGGARLIWNGGLQTAVLGADWGGNDETWTTRNGTLMQMYGLPAESVAEPELDTWAIYANDTVVFGAWSVTPGLRYDHLSEGGDFLSPSLGITCGLNAETLLRASVARGFSSPPTGWTLVGGLGLDPNPDLEPEEVWSYQAGLETRALPGLWLKAALFRHDLDKTFEIEPGGGGPPAYSNIVVNGGQVHRTGGEIEFETVAVGGFSLKGGFDYVREVNDEEEDEDAREHDFYGASVIARYDDGEALRVVLAGRYRWWDMSPEWQAEYDDSIWDLSVARKLFTAAGVTAEAGLAVHNLFNGDNYTVGDVKNARRWVEGGLRLTF